MDIWKSLSGLLRVRIVTPDPQRLLSQLTQSGVELFDLYDGNDLTISVNIKRKDLKTLRLVAKKIGASVRVVGRSGVFWVLRRVVFRPLVLTSLLLLLITAFYLPSRVCFVEIQGNDKVPANLILDCAEECGVVFGADRAEVRSERVKNMLLAKIPQIQWVGINTRGCTAVISVREKSVEEHAKKDDRICSIVAVCDGVVDQCTVTKGNALCSPGVAVTEGQVLVSAYTDCGITIQATHAEAEIFGTTKRHLEVVAPLQTNKRVTLGEKTRKFSLIIGKKQIKFYKGSGISDAECVKMKSVKYLTLPGGYRLPIAFVTEWTQVCDDWESVVTDTSWLESYSEAYLRSVMISGRILNSAVTLDSSGGVHRLVSVCDCYELIGIPKYEEILGHYGKTDRENRQRGESG